MKIVVLAGGISTERDVSLSSGSEIYKALKRKGHQVILVDLFLGLPGVHGHLEELFDSEIDWAASIRGVSEKAPDLYEVKARRPGYRSILGPNVLELCSLCDIVFLGLHGEGGEDGRIQALFDLYGIRYTGTGHASSALCMDKSITKEMFRCYHVPTPAGITVRSEEELILPKYFTYPCMVKTCCGGSSVGVYRVENEDELHVALKEAFTYEDHVIIEKCIIGREFSIAVVEGKALPVIEIAPLTGFYDYKNKYNAGSTIETCPAKITPEQTSQMQAYAELGYKVLNLQAYGRLDFIMDENGAMYCLEANTLPGMTPTSLIPQEAKVLGIDYPELCEKLIEVSLKKYQ